MRDENSDWGFGYNQFLGKCSIFDTELWGILDDLKIIQQRGNDKVIIQSDKKENLQVFETPPREALEFLETDKERSICIP
ncbi:hypothetical protein Gotur_029431 [Gossypium turneri]